MTNKTGNDSSKVSRTFSISLDNWKKLDSLQKTERLKTLSDAADLAISRGLLLLKPYQEVLNLMEHQKRRIAGLEKDNMRLKAMMSPKTREKLDEAEKWQT